MRIKSIFIVIMTCFLFFTAVLIPSCAKKEDKEEDNDESIKITILASASLKDVCAEIETCYEKARPIADLVFSFGEPDALQTQIEEGTTADIFISASNKQMDALIEKGLMLEDTVTELFENKIVLIVPADSDLELTSFEDVLSEKVTMIALGEPGSVLSGQYAEEVFTTLNILDSVKSKANNGQDDRTVLTWVEEGAADCGVVYASDAKLSEKVKIVCEAPEGSYGRIVYPIGIVASSKDKELSKEILAFFEKSDLFKLLYLKYGFTPIK